MAPPAWNADLRSARGPQGRKRVGLHVQTAPYSTSLPAAEDHAHSSARSHSPAFTGLFSI